MTTLTHSRVLLFGKLKAFAPTGEIQVSTSPAMTPRMFREAVAKALGRQCSDFRGISELLSSAVATSDRVLSEIDELGEGVEFALLPPVCGG